MNFAVTEITFLLTLFDNRANQKIKMSEISKIDFLEISMAEKI